MSGVQVCFNTCSEKCLRGFPPAIRDTILALQVGIHKSVLRVFPGAVASSGFRCQCENTRVGGKAHSLHLVGAARDYCLVNEFPRAVNGLKVIRERDHFHVELK